LLTVTLIALVGAIAAPSLLGQIERRETRLALSALQTGMTDLRYQAVLAAAPVAVAAEEINNRFDDVPDGWRVTANAPLHISAGGLCDGETVLTLTSPDQRLWHRRATAPHCNLERVQARPGPPGIND
jgi:Tfp pilus assembly protein FimT